MNKISAFILVAFALIATPSLSALGDTATPAPPKPDISVSMKTQDPYNAFTSSDGTLPYTILVTATLANGSGRNETVTVTFTTTDYWGNTLNVGAAQSLWVANGQTALCNYPLAPTKFGAYDIHAHVSGGALPTDADLVAIVVPPPHAGLRPESFFASNTYMGQGIDLHRKIGLKIYRQHFADSTHSITPDTGKPDRKPTDPFRFDFTEQDKYVADCAANGISIVGIVGYANQQWGLSDEGRKLHMYGPPRDINEFINATVPVVAHFTSIKYWEFWNEPWIYGWTWAGTPSLYRDFQGSWIRAAKRARPDIKVLAGNSASFLQDNIEPDAKAYKGIQDAETNHPYRDGGDVNDRRGGQQRYTDFGVQEAIRMGIPMHFITENGTDVSWNDPPHKDNPLNAPKLVVMHVIGALAGEYEEDVQQEIGWGTTQMRGSAAYAIMTHFLEDRVPVADIWPSHPLIWGGIFANSRFADKSLPRAKTLSARWGVDGLPDDDTKVAVVWNYTGIDAQHLDNNGTLTISPAGDLQAYDLMGNPTGHRSGDTLTVPFSQYPVYLTTVALTVKKFDALVGAARIDNVTPLNMYAYSFTKPVDQHPDLIVRVQNQLNRPVDATLQVAMPAGWTGETTKKVTLAPSQLTDVSFAVTTASTAPNNLYNVTVTAATDAGPAVCSQVVQAAYAPRKTIVVDGDLSDWAGVTPVTVDSDYLGTGADWTQAVLNPNRPRPDAVTTKPRVVARAYTAWDANNFYAAFAVTEPELKNSAGTDCADPKYKHAMLDGIDFPIYTGDAIEFVFGINERAADDYRKPNDPWYWKGDFRDTDYQYLTYTSTLGPQLLRLNKPGIPYRDGFQTEAPPGQGPVPGSKIAIERKGDVSIYELSIPRSELGEFKPEKMPRIRFGFMVSNDEGVGPSGELNWSDAAGVFDYWENNGSYQPTWNSGTSAQTAWGFGQ